MLSAHSNHVEFEYTTGGSMLDAAQLAIVFPNCKNPEVWAVALARALPPYSINSTDRIANFLAQTGYESGQYNRLEENLSYSTPERLMKVWPKRFPDLASTNGYLQNPKALGNFVYSHRLGNGDAKSGDGYNFRGRGIVQLTGRSNYESAGKALKIDLLTHPEQLIEPDTACLTAAWFWQTRGLNALADDRTDDDDSQDFAQITYLVNGSKDTVKQRYDLYKHIRALM